MNLKNLILLTITILASAPTLFAGPKKAPGVQTPRFKAHIPPKPPISKAQRATQGSGSAPLTAISPEDRAKIIASFGVAEGRDLAQKLQSEAAKLQRKLTVEELRSFFKKFVGELLKHSRNFYELLLTDIRYSAALSPLGRVERTYFYEAILKTKNKAEYTKEQMNNLVEKFYELEDQLAVKKALDEFVKTTEDGFVIPEGHDSWIVWCNMVNELPAAAQD